MLHYYERWIGGKNQPLEEHASSSSFTLFNIIKNLQNSNSYHEDIEVTNKRTNNTLKNSYTWYSESEWFDEYRSAMNLLSADTKFPNTAHKKRTRATYTSEKTKVDDKKLY